MSYSPVFQKVNFKFSQFWLFLLLAMNAPAQDIFFNRVSPPSGKNFYHVTGMVQDAKGYMWLATKNGLYRYDGYQMQHFRNNPLDANSLGSDYLEAIAVDPSGVLWIGTFSSGLDRFDPATGRFTHFKHNPADPSSLTGDTVHAVMVDRKGTVWVGAKGLSKFDPAKNNFIHYRNKPNDVTSLSNDEVRAIYEDQKGVLWVGTGSVYGTPGTIPSIGGLNRMDAATGGFTRYMHDPANPKSISNNKVRAIFEDSKGNFWVGTAGTAGLHIMNRATGSFENYPYDPKDPGKLSRPPLKKAPYYDHVSFITEDGNGNIWIGSAESGINFYNTTTKRVRHFESGSDSAGSFRDYSAWWACRSREGVLWISTINGNLYRINPLEGSIPFFTVPSNGVTSIYEAPDKTVWLGLGRNGMLHTDASGKLIKHYQHDPAKPTSLGANDVSSIIADEKGRMWVATFSNGLYAFDGKEIFTAYRHEKDDRQSIANNTVLSLCNDDDFLWVGTFHGLSRFDKKTGRSRNYIFYEKDPEESSRNVIPAVFKDRFSKIWVGCWHRGGVQLLDPQTGKYKTYLDGASVARVYEDHTGVLWAAANEGLYRLDREKDIFERFEDPAFLAESQEVRNLVEDKDGNLWMTTQAGLLRLNKDRNESTLFGRSYGLNGNYFFTLTGYRTRDGKLFFGYEGGCFAFYPADLARGIKAPELLLTGFRLANEPVQPGLNGILNGTLGDTKKIRLNYKQDVFSFEFTGIDYSNPEDNRHLFMLENYDGNWNLAGAERKATYFNVPPGKYIFRVKVVNSFGVWTEKSIPVIITPPWWTTWWFRIGLVLLIAGLFYSFVRWRIRQKFNQQLERSEKDKQLAELNRKTGELEMQALRAQMNPHFVFNSLNAINRFILQNNKTQASEYLTKFSRLVRMILQNSQSTLITLESELESLRLYLELEALRFDYRFEYSLNVPKDIDIEVLKVPPLIIQPYAENAIWHGLMHKEEKGHLWIDIRQEKDHLFFSIKDDGIGRKQSATMTSKSATRHKSMGLTITADRIAHMQRGTDASPVEINDLYHRDGTAAGTEVIIKIPVIYD
jgi:ligand-binding sensor domain-containing protein